MQLNIEFDSVGYIRAYDYEGQNVVHLEYQDSLPKKGVTYALSQHYGKSNSGVDDADFLITAKAVIKQLNEANKQKQ